MEKDLIFMDTMKKLPDAEFDIMKVVWANEPPITTSIIMEQLGNERAWKAQTVISLMLRLVDRGFLSTAKQGIYHMVKHCRFLKMTKRWSDPVTDAEALRLFQDIRKEAGISGSIDLYQCECVGTPMLTGDVGHGFFFCL